MMVFAVCVCGSAFAADAQHGTAASAAGAPGSEQRIEEVRPSVRVVSGQVEISIPGDESMQVYVYALTGQVVKHFTAQPGVSVLDLPAGYYIVKCGHLSQRVVVR